MYALPLAPHSGSGGDVDRGLAYSISLSFNVCTKAIENLYVRFNIMHSPPILSYW